MRLNIYAKTIFWIIVTACIYMPQSIFAQLPVFDVYETKEVNLNKIPSASGIVKFQDYYFVVGDDSPYLFQLNSELQIINKIKIFSDKKLQDNRLPKDDKPDFECITVVPWGNDNDLLVFGSGSSKEREVMVRIDIDGDKISVDSYSLEDFYKHLKKKISEDKKLNIEGVTYWDNKLVMLNRSDNTLFKIDLDDFKEYIRGDAKDIPKVKSVNFTLPSINGISARFSGLSVIQDEDIVVFTASVENDPNWIINENIICSYLGIIDMNQPENNEPICKLITRDSTPVQEKVESVFIQSKTDNLIKLIGVIDNDNGSSKLIEFELRKM